MDTIRTHQLVKYLKHHGSLAERGVTRLKRVYRPIICPFDTLLNLIPNQQRVLDIGCGIGTFLQLIAEYRAPRSLAGIEIDASLLETSRIVLDRSRISESVRLQAYDGVTLPEWIREYKYVFLVDVLHHIRRSQSWTVPFRTLRSAPLGYHADHQRHRCGPTFLGAVQQDARPLDFTNIDLRKGADTTPCDIESHGFQYPPGHLPTALCVPAFHHSVRKAIKSFRWTLGRHRWIGYVFFGSLALLWVHAIRTIYIDSGLFLVGGNGLRPVLRTGHGPVVRRLRKHLPSGVVFSPVSRPPQPVYRQSGTRPPRSVPYPPILHGCLRRLPSPRLRSDFCSGMCERPGSRCLRRSSLSSFSPRFSSRITAYPRSVC